MAVRVWKDGESLYIEPRRLQGHLDAGWTTENPDRPRSNFNNETLETLGIEKEAPPQEQHERILGAMNIQV